MRYEPIEGSEKVCGVCGKIIYTRGDWAYYCKNKKFKVYACSYSCMRRSEREAEAKGRRSNIKHK